MTLSLATLALVAAHAPATVTLSLPAQTLEKALVPVGQALGTTLTASGLLKNEVVMIDVKDVKPEEVYAQIATATNGKWVDLGNGKRLDLDLDLDKKERNDALAERTKLLKEEIDKLVSDFRKQGTFDPDKLAGSIAEGVRQAAEQGQGGGGRPGMRMGQMMSGTPGGRAIIQTLSTFRAEDLARIGQGQRVVFSSLPTQMQKPLPGNSIATMRQFVNEQKLAMANMSRLAEQVRERRSAESPAAGGQPSFIDRLQNAVPAKSFLIVTRFGNGGALNLQYIVADAQGAALGNGNLTLGMTPPLPATGATVAEGGKGLALSETAAAAVQAFSRGNSGFGRGGDFRGGQEAPIPLTDTLKALLRDPVAHEPLSILPGEVFKSALAGQNLIAVIPDSVMQPMARSLTSAKSPEQIVQLARSNWGLFVDDIDGWKVVTPRWLFEARDSRADRAAVKAVLDTATKKGSLRLDDVAAYASKSPVAAGGLDLALIRALDPSAAQSLNEVYGPDRDMLLMWNGMNANTRSSLAKGNKLQINAVSMGATALLADLVFNSMDGPRVSFGGAQRNANPGAGVPVLSGVPVVGQAFVTTESIQIRAEPAQQAGPGGRGGRGRGPAGAGGPMGGNMSTERTEVLPRGINGTALVSMTVRSESVAKAVVAGTPTTRVFSAGQMAAERAMAERPAPQGGPGGQQGGPQRQTIVWSGFVPGERSIMTFEFLLAPNVVLVRSLEDTAIVTGQPVALNQLPSTFQQEYQARYQQMTQRVQQEVQGRQRQIRGGRRDRTPPPTP